MYKYSLCKSLLFNFLVQMGVHWRDFKLSSNAPLWSHKPGFPTNDDHLCLQELGQSGGAGV